VKNVNRGCVMVVHLKMNVERDNDKIIFKKGNIMNWCKRDKRECIGEFCSMRLQLKESETYEDCPEFAIRGQRSKMNLYYDDFEYNTEVINEVIKDFITKPTK